MEEEESMLRDANQLLNCVTSGEEIKEVIHPKTGATALHIAAAKGYIKVMKWVFFLGYFLKPIFHWKTSLRWVPDANEMNTKNMKCTCPTQRPNARDPTQPIFHWLALGFGVGGNANLKLCVGSKIPTCWYLGVLHRGERKFYVLRRGKRTF